MKLYLEQEQSDLFNYCTKSILDFNASSPVQLSLEQIKAILPQRSPMLFIDNATKINVEEGLIEVQCDLANHWDMLDGHFPSMPIWPGVLQTEAARQTGQLIWSYQNNQYLLNTRLTHVHLARFISAITPPGMITIRAKIFDHGLSFIVVAQSLFQEKIASAIMIQVHK